MDTDGSITIKPSGGVSPYTYTWSPGSYSVQNRASVSAGTYTLQVKDYNNTTRTYVYNVGYKAKWNNYFGTASRNDSLYPSGPGPNLSSTFPTARTTNQLAASANGWAEIIVQPYVSPYVLGFLDSASVSGPGDIYDMDYALHITTGNVLYAWYGGSFFYVGTVSAGDALSVVRTGSTYNIKKNGTAVNTASGTTKKVKIKAQLVGAPILNIGTSFIDSLSIVPNSNVKVKPIIYHSTGLNINDGFIGLTPQTTTGTTTYTWTGGGSSSNGSTLVDKNIGTYNVKVADAYAHAASYTYNILYKTRWNSFSGVTFINDTLSAASNYTPTGWRTAISGNTLSANTDGELSWVVENNSNNQSAIGFAITTSTVPGAYSDINYGILQSNGGLYYIYSGQKSYLTPCQPGDVVSFKRQSSAMIMSLNSNIIFTVSVANVDMAWKIKAAIDPVVIPPSIFPNIGTSMADVNPVIYMVDDTKFNWNQENTYDETGAIIGSQKTYLDALGRNMQNLSKNNNKEVFASQIVYDSYGRSAIQTKAAFVGDTLTYKSWFMRTTNGQAYNYSHFDGQNLNNPIGLQTSLINTLGNYYSDNNPYDAYQATADNPYTRTVYNAEPGASPKSVSKPGTSFKQGSGKESYAFTMTAGDELKYVFGTNLSYKSAITSTNYLNCNSVNTGSNIVAIKYISISPDNKETVSYSVGGKIIASCAADLTGGETCTLTTVKSIIDPYGVGSVDIHVPNANKSSVVFNSPQVYANSSTFYPSSSDYSLAITDLYTDKLLIANTDYTINMGSISFSSAFLTANTGRSLILRFGFTHFTSNSFYTSILASYGSYTLGNVTIQYDLNYGRFSKNYYDLAGALRKSVSPKGMSNCSNMNSISMYSSQSYNHLGQIVAAQTPDQDTVKMIYDKEGKLRFSQNAKQKANGWFSYVNYDKHARVIESGENRSTNTTGSVWFPPLPAYSGIISATAIVDQQDGLLNANKTFTTVTCYTVPATADNIPASYTAASQYNSNFRNGQVNYIKNKVLSTWYNYDKVGRDKASVMQITDGDFVARNTGINNQIKTSEGTQNFFTGAVSSATYQVNNTTEKLKYNYTYDVNYKPVTTALNCASVTETLSTNVYNKMGGLKRVVLGKNYQGIDYVYTINGGLKAINHPGLDKTLDPGADSAGYKGYTNYVNKDLFGEIIEYHSGDYTRSNSNITTSLPTSKYNGLIYATRFKTRNNVGTSVTGMDYIDWGGSNQQVISGTYSQQELRFEYQYDQFNQLSKTIFANYNNSSNSITNRTEYKEEGASGGDIAYDKNGNITRLVRKAFSGNILDDLTYTVTTVGNKLSNILDAATYTTGFNFKTPSTSSSSSFSYNAIGELTVSAAEKVSKIDYTPDGKIKLIIFTNNDTTCFEYGPGGQKIKSRYYMYSTAKYKYTWYVGPYIYEYDQSAGSTFKIAEVKIPTGTLRANAVNLNSAYTVYQVSDHLGNVRATFKGSGTNSGITILSATDYYAFGGELPGRKWTSENYRYGYQSQEKPDATNSSNPWYSFELRMYNQDIGRWFATDPYGQYHSPYLAMGNNPVSQIDPDGGYSMPPNIISYTGADGKEQTFWQKRAGERQMESDRANCQGAFDYAHVNARYQNEYQNLREHFLGNDYGRRNDIDGFLKSVAALNNMYYGFNQDRHYFTAENGQESLTQNELSWHSDQVKATAGTIQHLEKPGGDAGSLSDTYGLNADLSSFMAARQDKASQITRPPVVSSAASKAMAIMMAIEEGESYIAEVEAEMENAAPMANVSGGISGDGNCQNDFPMPRAIDVNKVNSNEFASQLLSDFQNSIANGKGLSNKSALYQNAPWGDDEPIVFTNISFKLDNGDQVKISELRVIFGPNSEIESKFKGEEGFFKALNRAFQCRDVKYSGCFNFNADGSITPKGPPCYLNRAYPSQYPYGFQFKIK